MGRAGSGGQREASGKETQVLEGTGAIGRALIYSATSTCRYQAPCNTAVKEVD